MKRPSPISFIALFGLLQAASASPTEIKICVEEGEYLYECVDGEVTVKDNLIRLMYIGKNVSVSYRNMTDKVMKPKYAVRFYNKYGLLMGKDKVGNTIRVLGSNTRMEPKEVSSEKLHIVWYPLADILQNTDLPYKSAEDLADVKWVVISDTNTKGDS